MRYHEFKKVENWLEKDVAGQLWNRRAEVAIFIFDKIEDNYKDKDVKCSSKEQ